MEDIKTDDITPKRSKKRKLIIGAVLVGLVSVAAIPFAVAHQRHKFRNLTPDQLQTLMQDKADSVLDSVDATDQQKNTVDGVIVRVVPEIFKFKGQGKELKKKLHAELRKEKLDGEALETLRREAITLADQGSAKALEFLLEVGDILTYDQRIELLDKAEARRGRWHRGH